MPEGHKAASAIFKGSKMPAAYYRCELKTISRNAGHSATAASAYRSASKIQDTRTGLTHDYQRKSGVEHGAILMPEGTVWDGDRAALWNAAESAERRDNARVAREAVICFPHQLQKAERIQAAEDFGRWLANTYQVAVDVNLHQPGRGNDDRNYHAHVLFSTREYTSQGFGKKTRQLDDRERGPEEVKRIRAQWAATVNQALERAGHQERVDHRSYKARGIHRQPQVHLGRSVIEMTKRGVETEMMDRYREIETANDNIARIETELAALQRELQAERHREVQQQRIRQQYRETHRQHRQQRRRDSRPTERRVPLRTAPATRQAWASQHPINRRTTTRRRSIPQAAAGQGEGGHFLRWGRPLKVKFSGRWPGRYRLSPEAKQAAVEGYAALSLEAVLKGQGTPTDQDPATKSVLAREWQILKRMQQGGFSKLQITHALRIASEVVETRHGAEKGEYIHRVTDKLVAQAKRQVKDVSVAPQRQTPEDLRRLIGQFREYRDRERSKPRLGASPIKEVEAKTTEARTVRFLRRWRAAERQQAVQYRSLTPTPSLSLPDKASELSLANAGQSQQQTDQLDKPADLEKSVPVSGQERTNKNVSKTRQDAPEAHKKTLPLPNPVLSTKDPLADAKTAKTSRTREEGRRPELESQPAALDKPDKQTEASPVADRGTSANDNHPALSSKQRDNARDSTPRQVPSPPQQREGGRTMADEPIESEQEPTPGADDGKETEEKNDPSYLEQAWDWTKDHSDELITAASVVPAVRGARALWAGRGAVTKAEQYVAKEIAEEVAEEAVEAAVKGKMPETRGIVLREGTDKGRFDEARQVTDEVLRTGDFHKTDPPELSLPDSVDKGQVTPVVREALKTENSQEKEETLVVDAQPHWSDRLLKDEALEAAVQERLGVIQGKAAEASQLPLEKWDYDHQYTWMYDAWAKEAGGAHEVANSKTDVAIVKEMISLNGATRDEIQVKQELSEVISQYSPNAAGLAGEKQYGEKIVNDALELYRAEQTQNSRPENSQFLIQESQHTTGTVEHSSPAVQMPDLGNER